MEKVKPLLVGEAPSKNEATEAPLAGRVGRRLASLCGLSFEEYLDFFERVNLLHVRQDTKEKGFEFDFVAATQAAHALWLSEDAFASGRTILLLGRRVARAFSETTEYFEGRTTASQGIKIYVLPHPSGVSRWWNEEANYRRAAEFMQWIVVEHSRESAVV